MSFVVPNDNLDENECPLAVIKCVDWRFRKTDQEFIEKELGFEAFDLYAWPGSAKDVLKNNGFKTDFIDKLVAVSKNLHSVKKVLLLWHWDCDAYGGSKNFSSVDEEIKAYLKDIQIIRGMLVNELPADLEIIMAYSKPAPQGLEYIIVE